MWRRLKETGAWWFCSNTIYQQSQWYNMISTLYLYSYNIEHTCPVHCKVGDLSRVSPGNEPYRPRHQRSCPRCPACMLILILCPAFTNCEGTHLQSLLTPWYDSSPIIVAITNKQNSNYISTPGWGEEVPSTKINTVLSTKLQSAIEVSCYHSNQTNLVQIATHKPSHHH